MSLNQLSWVKLDIKLQVQVLVYSTAVVEPDVNQTLPLLF